MRRCLLPALLLLQLGCGQNPGGGGKPPPLTGKQRERAAQRLLLDLPTVEEKLVGAASYGNLTLMTELLAAGAVVDAMPSLEAVAVVTGQVPGATPLGAAVRHLPVPLPRSSASPRPPAPTKPRKTLRGWTRQHALTKTTRQTPSGAVEPTLWLRPEQASWTTPFQPL